MATTLVSLNQPLAVGTFFEVELVLEEDLFHVLTGTFMFREHAFQTIYRLALLTLSLLFSAVLLQCPFFAVLIRTEHPIVLLCEFPELDLPVFLLLRLSQGNHQPTVSVQFAFTAFCWTHNSFEVLQFLFNVFHQTKFTELMATETNTGHPILLNS